MGGPLIEGPIVNEARLAWWAGQVRRSLVLPPDSTVEDVDTEYGPSGYDGPGCRFLIRVTIATNLSKTEIDNYRASGGFGRRHGDVLDLANAAPDQGARHFFNLKIHRYDPASLDLRCHLRDLRDPYR
jgi:hypothetical protein